MIFVDTPPPTDCLVTEQGTREDISGWEGNQAQEGKYQRRMLQIFSSFYKLVYVPPALKCHQNIVW